MNNTGLLAVIAILLFGVFTIMLIQHTEETPAEQVSNSMSNLIDTVTSEVEEDADHG
jgi:hypothetical protein